MPAQRQQRAEVLERLVASAEQLASVGRWRNDLLSGEVIWSDQVFRIFGLEPREQAPAAEVTVSLFHPEDRDPLFAAFERCRTSGEDYQIKNRVIRPCGQIRTVISKAEAERASDGRIVAVRGVFVDVTEQAEAERELRRTRAFLDTLLDNMPVMLLAKGADDGRYVLWNRMAEQMTGLGRDRVLGATAHDLFPADEAAETARLDRLVLDTLQPLVSDSTLAVADGEVRQVVTRRIVLVDQDGRPEFTAGIVEDVTERTRSAQALTEALARAEAANRSKTEFMSNMSHEIRTPLNGVLGLTSVITAGDLSATQREAVAIIDTSARTLDRLLSDILDIARVETGRLEIMPAPFDCGQLIESAFAVFELQARQKGLAYTLEVAPEARGWAFGDSVRVGQILSNLLSNAVKFTEQGGICLRVRRVLTSRGPTHRFDVIDSGIGFSAEASTRIFGRFEQADGSITRRFGGSGLGLAISHQLARLMAGQLRAHSDEGAGATFTLDLPLGRADLPLTTPSLVKEGSPPQVRLRVLLVEDHVLNRRVVNLILSAAEIDVIEVTNGAEALDALGTQTFDVVLMDMHMPVLDGLSALERLRAREAGGDQHTPVVMLSANAMPEHRVAADQAGADGYVTKPIRPEVLLAEIARVRGEA